MKVAMMTTTSTTTVTRLEFTAEAVEQIVRQWLEDRKGIELDSTTEYDWDASSEGLVRGLTVTTRKTEEATV